MRLNPSANTPVACAWVQDRLFAYLDGDLAPGEMPAVRAHLDACRACRREIAIARQTEQALTSASATLPQAGDLRAGFYARLAASETTRRRRPDWRLAAPAFAALLLAALAAPRLLAPRHTLVTKPPVAPSTEKVKSQDTAWLLAIPNPLEPVWAQPHVWVDSTPVKHWPLHHRNTSGRMFVAGNISGYRTHSGRLWARRYHASASVQLAYANTPGSRRSDFALAAASGKAAERVDRAASEEQTRYRSAVASKRANPQGERKVFLALAKPASASPEDAIDFHIRDEVRGFTASTHIGSTAADGDGGAVVTVEESSAPLPASPPSDADSGTGF